MTFDCEATYRRMQDYLDRELTDEETRRVREHLAGCGMCAEEYLFEDSVLRRVQRDLGALDVPADLLESVMARIPIGVGPPVFDDLRLARRNRKP